MKFKTRCSTCGIFNEIDTKYDPQNIISHHCSECNYLLLTVHPKDTENDIVGNVILHDETARKWIEAANIVHKVHKGYYCGNEKVIWMICRDAIDTKAQHHFVSLKILENFEYNIETIGEFYRWYNGIVINKKGKVTNKSTFATRFVAGQAANQVVPGASIALSIMYLFSGGIQEEIKKYTDFYEDFRKKLAPFKELSNTK